MTQYKSEKLAPRDSMQRYNKNATNIVIFVSIKSMAMAFNLSFFKTPKHRVFNYQPLYYDERKERLEERIAKAREEEHGRAANYVPGKNIRTNFRKALYDNRKMPGSPLIMRIVILISLLGLMVAMYFVARSIGLFFM